MSRAFLADTHEDKKQCESCSCKKKCHGKTNVMMSMSRKEGVSRSSKLLCQIKQSKCVFSAALVLGNCSVDGVSFSGGAADFFVFESSMSANPR